MNGVGGQLQHATFEDFLRAPIGRFVVGASFIVWCHSLHACGSVHFGRRDENDARSLLRLYGIAEHLEGPVDRVIDGREIEHIDADGYDAVQRGLTPSLVARLAPMVGRQAVLVRPGFSGAVKAALLAPLGPTDRFRIFVDPDAAFAHAYPEQGQVVRAEVERVIESVRGVPSLLRAVRKAILANLERPSVSSIAAELRLSGRTLQRRLGELGVSFRDELSAARVQTASALLRETDLKIEVVARRVGCHSASRLAALFRDAGLGSPSSVRAERA